MLQTVIPSLSDFDPVTVLRLAAQSTLTLQTETQKKLLEQNAIFIEKEEDINIEIADCEKNLKELQSKRNDLLQQIAEVDETAYVNSQSKENYEFILDRCLSDKKKNEDELAALDYILLPPHDKAFAKESVDFVRDYLDLNTTGAVLALGFTECIEKLRILKNLGYQCNESCPDNKVATKNAGEHVLRERILSLLLLPFPPLTLANVGHDQHGKGRPDIQDATPAIAGVDGDSSGLATAINVAGAGDDISHTNPLAVTVGNGHADDDETKAQILARIEALQAQLAVINGTEFPAPKRRRFEV